MKEIKYLHWIAIFTLLIVMVLMLLLDYGLLPLLIFLPILFNLILSFWAKSLENRKGNDGYFYHFQNIFLILISLIALFPAVFGITAMPSLIERIPEYYSIENRIERKLDQLAMIRFEKFKNLQAPIQNGIWVESRRVQRPYDFGGICVVPCVNGQIHGTAKLIFSENWEKRIYFNQGNIDSIHVIENQSFNQGFNQKFYQQTDDNYLQINYTKNNDGQILIDTFVISREWLNDHFW